MLAPNQTGPMKHVYSSTFHHHAVFEARQILKPAGTYIVQKVD